MLWQGLHTNDIVKDLYKKAAGHNVYGSYIMALPVYNIADPELIRRVLVKDFDHFVDRQDDRLKEMTRSKTDEVRGQCKGQRNDHYFIGKMAIFLKNYVVHSNGCNLSCNLLGAKIQQNRKIGS
jgi:hypothetical protein